MPVEPPMWLEGWKVLPDLWRGERGWKLSSNTSDQWFNHSCVCVCVCVCMHAQSPRTCDPVDSPARFLCLWNFPGKNTGVGCHFLRQEIFPKQGSNPCLLSLLSGKRVVYHCVRSCLCKIVSIRAQNEGVQRASGLVNARSLGEHGQSGCTEAPRPISVPCPVNRFHLVVTHQ